MEAQKDLETGGSEGQPTTISVPPDSNLTPKPANTSSTIRKKCESVNDDNDQPDTDDDHVLAAYEQKTYKYTCHEKSRSTDTPFKRAKTKVTAKVGRKFGLRLTPPMYRNHEGIAPSEFEGNLFQVLARECMEQLYDDNPDGKFGSIGVLSFARLHHMNLHYFEADLAAELARIVEKKNTDRRQMMRVRKKLREYGAAIEDYQRVLNHWHQPLEGKLTAFHNSILPEQFRTLIESDKHCTWDNAYIPLASGNPWATGFVSRIGAALFGGLALLIPMLIMAVHDASTRNLVTTSVAVGLVAICLASLSLGSWRDVLGITAAYAAVLVVFVGTSTPQITGQGENRA